jgi:hypothetical protein
MMTMFSSDHWSEYSNSQVSQQKWKNSLKCAEDAADVLSIAATIGLVQIGIFMGIMKYRKRNRQLGDENEAAASVLSGHRRQISLADASGMMPTAAPGTTRRPQRQAAKDAQERKKEFRKLMQ